MIPEEPIWDSWVGAEAYREYVETYPLYPALNRRAAELADLQRARRVLDLGCGSGLTTAACLSLLPADSRVLAIDGASIMVEIARARVRDTRAEFLQLDAGNLSRTRGGGFDRAVCNAALWLFPRPEHVLSDLRESLTGGALFVFNIPAERIEDAASTPDPFQVELGRTLMCHRFGRQQPQKLPLFDMARIEHTLDCAHFRLERTERYTYTGRQQELMELMRIPAMTARLLPGMAHDQRDRIVLQAAARCDPAREVEVPWIYFVARAL